MKKILAIWLSALLVLLPIVAPPARADLSRVAGRFVAVNYGQWGGFIVSGNSATGTQTITVGIVGTLPDGRPVPAPFAGQVVGVDVGANNESVTLTAVSPTTCLGGGTSGAACFNVSGSFNNLHGASQAKAFVTSSGGLDEAIYDASQNGGGIVTIDNAWNGANSNITAAPVFGNVNIEDDRGGGIQFWVPVGGLTTLAAPTTLTAVTALPSATPVGAFGTGTYHMCIAYVDIMGQEGPCSADFSEAGLATGSFIFSAPAASAGAVGYTIYIGLTGGGVTNLDYKVPITSSICTLTKLESTTAACAVSNTTYNQSGAAATVTAITVSTSPINPAVTVVSTTAIYVPQAGGRTTYAYTPAAHLGIPGLVSSILPFTISAADATTVPSVIGTINLPPGVMNLLGRGIEVCGYATTSASTGTIKDIQFQWDAFGQNTAGKGVVIGDLTVTQTSTSVTQLTFCEDFQTTVAGAGATAGSIQNAGGFITSSIASLSAGAAGGNTIAGATALLNLASEARLNIIYLHTTGTDGTAVTLQAVTIKALG